MCEKLAKPPAECAIMWHLQVLKQDDFVMKEASEIVFLGLFF